MGGRLIVDGVQLGEEGGSTTKNVLTIVLVALVFGLLNAVVKPIAKLLSLPFIVLTLGLFLIVVNAFMLQVLEWIATGSTCRSPSTSSGGTPSGRPHHLDRLWALNLVLPDDD